MIDQFLCDYLSTGSIDGVGMIKVGFDYSDKHREMIFINALDEDIQDTGQCIYESVKQKAIISVIRFIDPDTSEEVKRVVSQTVSKIAIFLRQDLKLGKKLYFGRIEKMEYGNDFINQSGVVICNIYFDAGYFRRVQ